MKQSKPSNGYLRVCSLSASCMEAFRGNECLISHGRTKTGIKRSREWTGSGVSGIQLPPAPPEWLFPTLSVPGKLSSPSRCAAPGRAVCSQGASDLSSPKTSCTEPAAPALRWVCPFWAVLSLLLKEPIVPLAFLSLLCSAPLCLFPVPDVVLQGSSGTLCSLGV